MKPYGPYILPQIGSLREMTDLRVKDNPDGIAFFYTGNDGSIVTKTYRRFSKDVNAVGTYLYAHNFREGSHIALLGVNFYEWLVTFFAIANGGNVALPMDARQPIENIIKLCANGDCAALAYSEEFAAAIPAFRSNLSDIPAADARGFVDLPFTSFDEWVSEGAKMIDAGDTSFIDHKINVDDMCALVFTSGTTGIPKGVMLSQKNIAANINQACKNFVLEGNGLSPLPMHHMFGLIVGHLMVFNYNKPCYIVRNIRNLMKDIQIAKPECLFVVPMIIETFAKQFKVMAKRMGGQITPEQVQAMTGGNLRFIICGGAPLSAMYVKMFRQFGLEILNGYGITECSPVLAVNRNEDMCDGSVGPVLFGCEVKISDEGEILAKGDNVMLGYYRNPEATAEALQDGWFHTGDLGKIEDHYLFITGRTKNLIITSSGENISPEELEEKVLADPAVAEAIVYDVDDVLAVQIYPEKEAGAPAEYFQALLDRINKGEPVYRQLKKLVLRDEPFIRNSTGKIIRTQIKGDMQ